VSVFVIGPRSGVRLAVGCSWLCMRVFSGKL